MYILRRSDLVIFALSLTLLSIGATGCIADLSSSSSEVGIGGSAPSTLPAPEPADDGTEFDYRGDTQRVPGEIVLTLESGKYELKTSEQRILGEVHSGELIDMHGFNSLSSPGDPILPFRIYDVVVPPNIDWDTTKLALEQVETVSIPGEHVILPAPPLRARVDDEELVEWGQGKDIVNGRNMRIYGSKEFFPKEPVTILSRSQMRKWRFIRLGFTPVQYNPLDRKLRLIKSVHVQFTFKRIGTKVFRSDPLLGDTVMDDEAEKRFINFREALEWYRYVPASQSGDVLDDPDYVIITTNAIRDGSARLTDFVSHKTSLGHAVQIVTEDDYGSLTGQPPDGTAEKIRQWLINNYASIGIRYVLLIGDPDPDDPFDDDDSIGDVPMKMCWPRRHAYKSRESPTDYFYADLTGNWDLDGDGFFGEPFSSTNPVTPDPAVNPETFSVCWTGRVEADAGGTYEFATSSDEGIRVIIDAVTVIDNWTAHLPTTDQGSITLTPGQHDIQVEFYDDTGDATARLFWLPPGQKREIVPPDKLYHLIGTTYVSGGLDGEYFNNIDFTASALTRVDSTIDFYWGTGDKGPGGVDFTPDLYVGRIPVYGTDYTTLDNILQKMIDYETGIAPAWRRRLLTANVYMWGTKSDYLLGEALKQDFADPLAFSTYRVYESDFGLASPPECPVINPKDANPAAPCNMLQELANGGGYGLLTWSTHGGSTGASHLINSPDCASLDDSTPVYTFQGSCANGYPENSNNLGYSLLKQGAIATVSASRASLNSCFNPAFDPNPLSGTNANLTYHYAMRIMQDTSSGRALYVTKDNVNPDKSWMNKMDYNIYGDPSVCLVRLCGVVLLFDTSGSMSWRHDGTSPAPPAEQRIAFTKAAAYPFMEMLDDFVNKRVNFGIATFPPHPWNSAVGCNGQVITPMTLVTEASKDTAITTTIPGLVAEGNTPLLAGMNTAAGMFGSETSRVVVLLSDGYHNCPFTLGISHPDVTDLIDQLKLASIKVFTIGFGRPSDVDHPLLESLATETGGQFYDVTTASFDPLTWNPATDLQATYKAILVDTLGLETAADPLGVIKAGKRVTYEVRMNEHDRQVSFYLSWVTPREGRLGLTVRSSDGQEIPVTHTVPTPGVRIHAGKTYKIITVDRLFLTQSGKVGPTPWEIEIDANNLDQGESENYQYSVILDSALKMKSALDKAAYRTGETITITAKITEAGQPVTGLKDIYAKVTRPENGAGNWFAENKVSIEELKQIPVKKGDENLSPLLRKAMFLTDIRKVEFPVRTGPAKITLYDDGTHGDTDKNDGVYTNRFTDTVREGTYSFYFHATGPTRGGNTFDRDGVIQKYITVRVVPEHILVEVDRLPSVEDNLRRFEIAIMPGDPLGNYLGPRHSKAIKLIASQGSFVNELQDNLDGTYSQILQLPASVNVRDVDIEVNVRDATLSFNLAEKVKELERPYSVSLHLGGTIPIGDFNESFNPGFSVVLDFDYHLTPRISIMGLLGYDHFRSGSDIVDGTYWSSISANLKYEFTEGFLRPYANAGTGIYIPESGDTKPGLNIGLGLAYPLASGWAIELGGDYHHIFTSGSSTQFLVPRVGLIHRF